MLFEIDGVCFFQDANQKVEMSNKEKEEINEKLTQAERMLAEGKRTVMKLEEDNAKLRRALEQSMTRLNRMSVDSDYFVDRFALLFFQFKCFYIRPFN